MLREGKHKGEGASGKGGERSGAERSGPGVGWGAGRRLPGPAAPGFGHVAAGPAGASRYLPSLGPCPAALRSGRSGLLRSGVRGSGARCLSLAASVPAAELGVWGEPAREGSCASCWCSGLPGGPWWCPRRSGVVALCVPPVSRVGAWLGRRGMRSTARGCFGAVLHPCSPRAACFGQAAGLCVWVRGRL